MKLVAVCTVMACLSPVASRAQGWEVDARTIGLSGIGGDQNIFTRSVGEARGDRSFAIPLGLFQTLRNLDTFRPRTATFDPLRAVEFGSNPLHLQFGRAKGGNAAAFVHGIRNASLSRDLNDYRGFIPRSFAASGLIAPTWGHTFRLEHAGGDLRHALYVGAGPHIGLQTKVDTDAELALVLGANEATYRRNTRFDIATQSRAQVAAALTGGYRGQRSFGPGGARSAFLSVNANYLHGIRYEDVDLALLMQTDASGRLMASERAPLAFDRTFAARGRGMSLDIGGGAVLGRWEIGASASNVGHRMTWRNVTQRGYEMPSLFSGDARLVITAPQAIGIIRTAAPVHYRGNASFSSRGFALRAELAREWDRIAVRAGIEQWRERIQWRAAAAYVDQGWFPTAGLSIGLNGRLWLDLAGFTTNANIERQRRFAVASSIRVTRR